MPFHCSSAYTAPRRPLSRDQRRIWLARAEAGRRAGLFTALHLEVGRSLLRRLGADGRLEPSHETLAADAACCPRTVRNALRRFRWAGLLEWTRRLVRTGRQVRQTSSAYLLSLTGSTAPVAAATIRPPREVKPPRSVAQQIASLAEWAGEKIRP